MKQGKIFYLSKEENGPVEVKMLEIVNYEIPQLDRIEMKLDSILEKLSESKDKA